MKCNGCGADFSAGDQPVVLRGDVMGVVCRNCQGFLSIADNVWKLEKPRTTKIMTFLDGQVIGAYTHE